ncbi:hypothetical protein Ae201684P_001797 [Aphanomyces euteiches]|nr:hypothetical protein Ae201684P_001797 [Aphanomyces euteiches]
MQSATRRQDEFQSTMLELRESFESSLQRKAKEKLLESPDFLAKCVQDVADEKLDAENISLLKSITPSKEAHDMYSLKQILMLRTIEMGIDTLVKSMLKLGANINHIDELGKTPLGVAVSKGHIDISIMLMNNGADVRAHAKSVIDENGATLLAICASTGNDTVAHRLLIHGADVNQQDNYGQTPLMRAIRAGCQGLALTFLDFGANPSAIDKCGKSPLLLAVWFGYQVLVRRLCASIPLEAINQYDYLYHRTPLWIAASHGNITLVHILLEAGADISLLSLDGLSAVDAADDGAHLNVLRLLRERGGISQRKSLVNQSSATNNEHRGKHSPAVLKALGGKLDLVVNTRKQHQNTLQSHKLLMKCALELSGANVSPDSKGCLEQFKHALRHLHHIESRNGDRIPELILHFAVLANYPDIAELLLRTGADVNLAVVGENAPLMTAAEKGHRELALLLLSFAARVDQRNPGGETALWLTSKYGHAILTHDLILAGANDGSTALWVAARHGHADSIQILLNAGAYLNQENFKHQTPLCVAIANGHTLATWQLINHGADVNKGDPKSGQIPLLAAASVGDVDIINELQARGASFQNCFTNALFSAVRNGHYTTVEILLESAEDVRDIEFALDIVDCEKHEKIARRLLGKALALGSDLQGVLWLACCHGRSKLVLLLLRHGANPNGIHKNKLPLWLAIVEGNEYLTRLLLDFGAHVNRAHPTDFFERIPLWAAAFKGSCSIAKYGNTPLWIAANKGHEEMVRFLLEIGANANLINETRNMTPYMASIEKKAYPCAVACFEYIKPHEVVFQDKLILELVGPHLTIPAALNLLSADLPFDVEIDDDFVNGQYQAVGFLINRPNHEHSWTKFQDGSFILPQNVRLETTRKLLNLPMFATVPKLELFRQFATLRDPHGREVLSITDASTRQFFYENLFFCGRYELFSDRPIHKSATSVVINAYDHGLYNQLFHHHARDGRIGLEAFTLCMQQLYLRQRGSPVNWEDLFRTLDKQRNGTLTEADFMRCCSEKFGVKYKVALKFMKHQHEFELEIASRKTFNLSAAYVVQTLPSIEQEVVQRSVFEWTVGDSTPLEAYPYMLVLPPADRSLEDIFTKERPSPSEIRSLMSQVVHALAHLHEQGIAHGDLKMSNVLRLKDSLKLIDLDASARFGAPLGAKVSSGVLPPEMFCHLPSLKARKAHQRHWGMAWRGLADQKDLWENVKPSSDNIVVKSYAALACELPPLPFDIVLASPAADLWSLGCMFLRLCSRDSFSLLPTNRDDNLAPALWTAAMSWTNEALDTEIAAKVPEPHARDLIRRLLRVDPNQRLELEAVRVHPFFTATESLHDTFSILPDLALLRHVSSQSNLADVPTKFLLLPVRLTQESFAQASFAASIQCRLVAFVLEVGAAMPSVPAFMNSRKDSRFFLYLVDERTHKAIIPSANDLYPLDVKMSEAYSLPLLQISFSVMRNLSSTENLFGIPGIPPWSEALLAPIQDALGHIHDAMQSIQYDESQVHSFFQKHDPEMSYGGLKPLRQENGQVEWSITTERGEILQ